MLDLRIDKPGAIVTLIVAEIDHDCKPRTTTPPAEVPNRSTARTTRTLFLAHREGPRRLNRWHCSLN
jgi:hypothetical protein